MLTILTSHPIFAPVLFAILGAIFGSFIAAIVARWPRGESIMAGRSHCDSCQKTLSSLEIIPIISYLFQGGKCCGCATPIGRDALYIELAAVAIGALALVVAPGPIGASGAVFGWLLLALGWMDLRHFWLPDPLVLALGVAGGAAALLGLSVPLQDAALGGAVGFAGLWLIAALYKRARGRDGLGGGDPKLLGAIGIWMGWQALPFILLGASVLGLVAAALMAVRGAEIGAQTRLPLGSLLAVAGFAGWLVRLFLT